MSTLVPVDRLEIVVVVDNELDSLSSVPHHTVTVISDMHRLLSQDTHPLPDEDAHEASFEDLCCAAHGLALLIVCINTFNMDLCGMPYTVIYHLKDSLPRYQDPHLPIRQRARPFNLFSQRLPSFHRCCQHPYHSTLTLAFRSQWWNGRSYP